MKNRLLALTLILACGAFTNKAAAFPSPSEMASNFQICEANDSSWHRRWGQYVVGFDINTAAAVCASSDTGRGVAKLAACHAHGTSLYAGYYCYEIDGGRFSN